MTFWKRSLTYLSLILVAGLTLAACQNDRQSGSDPVAGSPTPPTPSGTGDVGGGNGYNGAVLESYRIDIFKLEAFEKILKNKVEFAKDSKDERKMSALLKTWYIAPIKLKPIDNSVLGLSFTDDQAQQLAVQTRSEVFIAKDFFDKMTLEQQADLIAHEILMALYLMKFETWESICIKSLSKEVDCKKWGKFAPFNQPSEKPRLLNDQDYENIRAATVWLMSQANPLPSDTFNEQLRSFGFDPRFFGNKAYGTKIDKKLDREMKTEEVFDLIARGIQKNLFEPNCISTYESTEKSVPCQLQLSVQIENETLKTAWSFESEISLKSQMLYGLGNRSSKPMMSERDSKIFELHQLNWAFATVPQLNLQPGDKFTEIFALIEKTTFGGKLRIELLAVLLVEKVFHGYKDIPSGPATMKCPENSFVLNPVGNKKYFLLKAKNTELNELPLMIEYGFIEWDCQSLSVPK